MALAAPAPARLSADTLFGGFGVFACMLAFTGALKSLPGVAKAPVDITPVLLAVCLAHAAWQLASRRIVLAPAVPAVFALQAAFAALAVGAGSFGQGREILGEKLRDVVMVAPVMLGLGVLVASDATAFRRFVLAAKVLGPMVGGFIAFAFAFGLVNVVVQFGGTTNVATQRVQYQLSNLLIAFAASAYSVAALRTRGVLRLANLAMTGVMAFAALIPGGRSGFIALCLVVVLGPTIALWHQGRRAQAIGLFASLAGVAALAVALLFASAQLTSGLRTIERLTQGGIGESSARLPLWRAAFALIEGNGFLGLGFAAYTASAGWGVNRDLYPHNLFIEAIVELGLPGLVLFVGTLAAAGLGWLSAMRRTGTDQWAISACYGTIMLVFISVSTDLGNPLLWFCTGVVAGTGGASFSRWPPPERSAPG